jgi:hypothetical protein
MVFVSSYKPSHLVRAWIVVTSPRAHQGTWQADHAGQRRKYNYRDRVVSLLRASLDVGSLLTTEEKKKKKSWAFDCINTCKFYLSLEWNRKYGNTTSTKSDRQYYAGNAVSDQNVFSYRNMMQYSLPR